MLPPTASAMAASMWFQGSAWPPGNQGIMPEGSCHSAIASTVAVSWSALRTPGISGMAASRTGGDLRAGLAGGDDEALAEHRVQDLLGPAGGPGRLLDVPHQDPVVRPDDRVIVVRGSDGALQPPVRG